jgi:ADP-heptose:LPS heptosyltransferase
VKAAASGAASRLVRILVLALAGIGDCLIATPLIHELRLHYPEAELEAFVFWPGSKDLLEGNPHLNAIHQKNLVKEGAPRAIRYLFQLRRRKYDITINAHPQGPIHYRVAAGIIGAGLRLSHRYDRNGLLDSLLVNRIVPQDYNLHSIENNNRLLELLGHKPLLAKPEMEIYLTAAEGRWAEEFLQQHRLGQRRRLGLHVGSGGTKNLNLKRWPLGHYIDLLQRLRRARPDLAVLLFGGPEEEKAHADILAAVGQESVYPVKSANLRQAAALLKHCHAFLSVDTALMHLAAAMKVPNQIVLEAPTLNKTNLPWQTTCRIVPNPMVAGRNLDYYRYDGGPIKGTREHLLACMASIKVEDVLQAVMESLP